MGNNRAKKKIGIFIDGANMYYASKKAGWKLDIEKFAKVITKSLKYINGQKKGNVDIEITLDVVRSLNDKENNTPDLAAGRISVLAIIDGINSLSRGGVNSKNRLPAIADRSRG